MSEAELREEIHLGAQGRLVIPARLRRQLGLRQGDTLIARSEQGRLIVEKAEGDRACISLAIALKLPVLTTDKTWKKPDLPLRITVIR
jgi:AbrB family looped-hinge helix DNA binding protein